MPSFETAGVRGRGLWAIEYVPDNSCVGLGHAGMSRRGVFTAAAAAAEDMLPGISGREYIRVTSAF